MDVSLVMVCNVSGKVGVWFIKFVLLELMEAVERKVGRVFDSFFRAWVCGMESYK